MQNEFSDSESVIEVRYIMICMNWSLEIQSDWKSVMSKAMLQRIVMSPAPEAHVINWWFERRVYRFRASTTINGRAKKLPVSFSKSPEPELKISRLTLVCPERFREKQAVSFIP